MPVSGGVCQDTSLAAGAAALRPPPPRLPHVTVAVAGAGRVGHDNLHAAVRCVVGPLALFAVVVSNVVGVRLFKLRRTEGGQRRKTEQRREESNNISGLGAISSLFLPALTCSPDMTLVNSERQKIMASSSERPMPLRKRPYCRRAPCLSLCSFCNTSCMVRMQRGNDSLASCRKEKCGSGQGQ